MLSGVGLSLVRQGRTILDCVSLSVEAGSRLGVVGPNGAGKTSLLRLLTGEIEPTQGRVERAPASLRVAYLSQESDAEPGESIVGYLARRTGVSDAEKELDIATQRLADSAGELEQYNSALERFLSLGGDDFPGRAERVLAEVGLPRQVQRRAVAELSGGQAARVRLAAIMLVRAEVLLLDEPTNDLDFEGLALLEQTVMRFPGAVVAVSHDRAFLDRAVRRILEIEEHTHRATEYAGGWSEFVDRRALARSQAGAAYEAWKAERDRLRARIRSQRAWAEEGSRRARKKAPDNDKALRGFRIDRTEKQAAKVRTSQRALERLGTVEKPWEGWQLQMDLSPTDRSGDVVVRLNEAVTKRGEWRLGPISLEIGWSERIVITGPNGSGKSTLLGVLRGEVGLSGGSRWVGPSVRFGELDQRRARLDGRIGVLAAFCEATALAHEEARSLLAKFGVTAELVGRSVGTLSPGERTRLQLAELMARGTNCLVLDEPTNHLDLPAIEQLEDALTSFSGTLIVVTHDRWLLESVPFDRRISTADLSQTGTVARH